MGFRSTSGRAAATGRQAMEQARQAASDIYERSSDVAGQAQEMAREGMGQLGDAASEYYEQGREAVQSMGKNVQRTISEMPLMSVLIAAGAGLLLGAVLMRSWQARG